MRPVSATASSLCHPLPRERSLPELVEGPRRGWHHLTGAPLSWPDPLPTSGPVRLRPFRDDDLGLVEELSRDPYVPLIGTVPAVFSEAAGRAYLARQHQRLTDGQGWSFAVARLEDDRAMGGATLFLHDQEPATGGYVIAPAHRGCGYATAALRAVTAFAWTVPRVAAVDLWVEPDNLASLAVAEHAGFTRLEVVPARHVIAGRPRDMVHLSRTRPS